MVLRAAVLWIGLAGVAIGAGALRETLLTPRMGSAAAHVVGTLVVVSAQWAVVGLTIAWVVPSLEAPRLWAVGAGFLAVTVLFEFVFGHWVMGHPWSRLLADYNLLAGRIWVLVLLSTLLAPVVLGRLRDAG